MIWGIGAHPKEKQRARDPLLNWNLLYKFPACYGIRQSCSRSLSVEPKPSTPTLVKSAKLALFSASMKNSIKVPNWHFTAHLIGCQIGNLPTFSFTFASSSQIGNLIPCIYDQVDKMSTHRHLLLNAPSLFLCLPSHFGQKRRHSSFYNRMRQRFPCKMTAKAFYSPSKASKNASMVSSVSWVGFCSAGGWK